jgi:hypothetical protein
MTLEPDQGTSQRFSPSHGCHHLREAFLFRIGARKRLSTLKKHPKVPTELVAPAEEWSTVVNPGWEDFKKSHGNVAVMER